MFTPQRPSKAWALLLVLIFALAAACGDDPEEKNQGGEEEPAKTLAELDKEEAKEVCEAMNNLDIVDDKAFGCAFGAEIEGRTGHEDPVETCEASYEDCLENYDASEAVEMDVDECAEEIVEVDECEVTVAEYMACLKERQSVFQSYAEEFSCQQADSDESPYFTINDIGPACEVYAQKCPELAGSPE